MSKFIKSLFGGGRAKEGSVKPSNTEKMSIQSNAGEQTKLDSGEQLVEQYPVEGTPFTIIQVTEREDPKKCFIAVGNVRVSDYMYKNRAQKMIEQKDWTLIVNTIAFLAGKIAENEVKQNKQA